MKIEVEFFETAEKSPKTYTDCIVVYNEFFKTFGVEKSRRVITTAFYVAEKDVLAEDFYNDETIDDHPELIDIHNREPYVKEGFYESCDDSSGDYFYNLIENVMYFIPCEQILKQL